MSEPVRLFMTVEGASDAWQQALDLARALVEHDVEVTLAVLELEPDGERETAARAVPGLRLLETGLPPSRMAETPEALEETSVAIARFANVVGVDIVHLDNPALAAAGRFDAPVVVTCDGCIATWWKVLRSAPMPIDLLWRTDLIRRGYRAASVLVAPTAAFAKLTARTYGLSMPPQVVHQGCRLSPVPERSPGGRDFVFTAGDLWDDANNLAALNRAASRLAVPIMAAGPVDGPDGEKADLGHLWTLSDLSDAEFTRWLGAAPLFASMACYEPSGTGPLAAARAGAALVLSDIPSFRELWDGAAVFVPAEDDAAIAVALKRVLNDAALRARLAQAARARSEAYTPEATAAGMMDVYRSMLSYDGELMPRLEAAE